MSDDAIHDVSLSSPQVVQQTGITYRELDHWARKGHVSPRLMPGQGKRRHPDRDPNTPGSGHSRRWMPEEVSVIGTMVRLARAGILPALASRIARGETEIGPGVTVTVSAPPLGEPIRPVGSPSSKPLAQVLGLTENDASVTQLRGDLAAIREAEAAELASIDAPWWLVREAVASTALDRDETVGTYSLPEEAVSAQIDGLWCLLAPKPGGGFAKIPAHSREHAEGMASRWKGDVQVAEWTGDPALHAAMLRGLDKMFRDE